VTHIVYEAEGWGVGELVVEGACVVWHELPWPRRDMTDGIGPGSVFDPSQTPAHPGSGEIVAGEPSRGSRGFVAEVVRLLQRYFAGEPEPLAQVPVDLSYDSTFLAACARALRDVPRGEVVTYGELAALAGAPGAARAAGSFCARNRLGLFVPCHRVVSADGIGSYGSYGLAYKRRLLELEGAL
jgi:methylated-DNA-[protein]-cysteine S-methyltransferase